MWIGSTIHNLEEVRIATMKNEETKELKQRRGREISYSKKKNYEATVEEVKAKTFPKLMKDIGLKVHEALKTLKILKRNWHPSTSQ